MNVTTRTLAVAGLNGLERRTLLEVKWEQWAGAQVHQPRSTFQAPPDALAGNHQQTLAPVDDTLATAWLGLLKSQRRGAVVEGLGFLVIAVVAGVAVGAQVVAGSAFVAHWPVFHALVARVLGG